MNVCWRYIGLLCNVVLIASCNPGEKEFSDAPKERVYKVLSKEKSGITFSNILTETNEFNYFFYPDIYGGGGVAIGDINNDGLPDIYFTGILANNALYVNKGGLQFEDITAKAGVSASGKWTKGVTMADVNGDGYLDIYVSVAGPLHDRKNLLFINNGNNTFTESAQSFGIADEGYSVQSAFFDYDRDGDLDLFIASNPPTPFQSRNSYFANKVKNPEQTETDKLYRNDDNDHFTDVTQEAGIRNFGLTLGISVADYNNDDWFDIYVSNDFNSPDYLYINNRDGTFSNEIDEYMRHTAQFGMGTDAADINNDGLVDLLQLDMSYESNWKKKTNMHIIRPEQFYEIIELGLHRQYMRNCFQLNTGLGAFSDIAEISGVANTDWSWSVLFMDMNNDGLKDLLITNGMRRDVNDMDFLDHVKKEAARNNIDMTRSLEVLKKIPVNPVPNFAFLNKGDLTFDHSKERYGLNFKGFTHGAAYADLDSDGDLDVITNNLEDFALVYENTSDPNKNNFLRFKLKGQGKNTFATGTKVSIFSNGVKQYQELIPTRGYLSSVEPVIHFGLGKVAKVDSAIIKWPQGRYRTLYDLSVNQVMEVIQNTDELDQYSEKPIRTIFTTETPSLTPSYIHRENEFNDFEREVLLPHRMSQFGPALAVADVNHDGLDDFYVGGAMGYAGSMYLQNKNGSFTTTQEKLWMTDKDHEDVAALFFDANNDEFPDLYVVSGGNEKPERDPVYQDRIYLNNGKGQFIKDIDALPQFNESGSRVKSADFDNDGDLDLFVGSRQIPGKYPMPATSYLLRNESTDGKVVFKNVTEDLVPMLAKIGMVTDAVWSDFNADGWKDLMIAGEWMPITLLKNNKGTFEDVSTNFGLDQYVGWWFSLASSDIDHDGDMDFIAGNLGLNYQYKASPDEPFEIFFGDFDNNDNRDIVLAYYNQHELYPVRNIVSSSQQMPSLKGKFGSYRDYANATLSEIYGKTALAEALHYEATTFATTVFENQGDSMVASNLDNYAQLSSVNTIMVDDFNDDSISDLILAGNLYEAEIETPRSDAGYGMLMMGEGNGEFKVVPPRESGIQVKGEVREIAKIRMADGTTGLLLARNEDKLVLLKIADAAPSNIRGNISINPLYSRQIRE